MTGSEMMMIAPVRGSLDAQVAVPGSKSITNRALVCALLAEGESRLERVAPGDDTHAMLDAVHLLGGEVRRIGSDMVEIDGLGGVLEPRREVLHAGLAGTTSRFVTALCALADRPLVVDGDPPLRRRPMGPLHDALVDLGASVTAASPGRLPVTVTGPLSGHRVAIAGDVSSQYVTALMLIGPLLPEGLHLELTSPLVSRPYVEMTREVMAGFGITGIEIGSKDIVVPAGRYRAAHLVIEPDASSASYPAAATAIVGGRMLLSGMSRRSWQGDIVIMDLLETMGVQIDDTASGLEIRASGGELEALGHLDLADASDLVPTVAVLAAFANGPTVIDKVGFIRAKESDRLGDLADELARLGARVRALPDGLEILPAPLHGARVETHHDHRLAMALSLVGLRVPGVAVADPQVVSKSWPDYFSSLETWSAPTR